MHFSGAALWHTGPGAASKTWEGSMMQTHRERYHRCADREEKHAEIVGMTLSRYVWQLQQNETVPKIVRSRELTLRSRVGSTDRQGACLGNAETGQARTLDDATSSRQNEFKRRDSTYYASSHMALRDIRSMENERRFSPQVCGSAPRPAQHLRDIAAAAQDRPRQVAQRPTRPDASKDRATAGHSPCLAAAAPRS